MSKKGHDDDKTVEKQDQFVDVDMDAVDVEDSSSVLAEHSKNYFTNFGNPLRNRTRTTFCDGCSHAHCIFCWDKPVVVPQVDEPCHCGTSTCLFRSPGLCGLRFPELVDQLNELKIKRNKAKKMNKYKMKALNQLNMVSKKLETPHFWRCGCRSHIVPRPDKGDTTFSVKIDSKRVGRLLEYPAPPWNRFGQGSSNDFHYHHSREHYPKIVKLQKQVKKLRKKSKDGKNRKSSSSSSSTSASDSDETRHHKRAIAGLLAKGRDTHTVVVDIEAEASVEVLHAHTQCVRLMKKRRFLALPIYNIWTSLLLKTVKRKTKRKNK